MTTPADLLGEQVDLTVGKRISVCLLTYNHVDLIESTLQSILDQTLTSYELVISDDCSTDGTWERILAIGSNDARVRPIQTPHNLGMAGNANFAVQHCARPYIALLHHDDLYRQDLLEKWAGVLDRCTDVSFVFNPYDTPRAVQQHGPRFNEEVLAGRWFLENFLLARWGCPVRGTAMIRKSLWDRVGGMREEFGLVADVDLWMRLSRVSQVGYVPEPLIRIRQVRPDYYPDIYTGKKWHWRRLLLIYEIYASNWLSCLDLKTIRGRLIWWRFRLKLSLQTTKWLIYAVVKGRHEMIASSDESVTLYDVWLLRAFRRLLQVMIRTAGN